MASYVEKAQVLMDWAYSFTRTGQFPLDRSSMFSSYADAVKYAKGDGSDTRGLGKTSYVGQVISVYENDNVTVYKICADRTLSEVGAITQGDNVSIEVQGTTLQLKGFDQATEGQIPIVAEDETTHELYLKWVDSAEHDVDALYRQVQGIDTLLGHEAGVDPTTEPATGIVADVRDMQSNKADKADTYTKTEVDGKIAGAFHYKGTKNSFAELQASVTSGAYTPAVGDVWNIATAGGQDAEGRAIKAGDNVACASVTTATPPIVTWDVMSGVVDLSAYRTSADQDVIDATKVDKEAGKSLIADTEITRLGTLEAISDATTGDGVITLTNKAGTTRDVTVYTLPTAGANLGGIKSTAASTANANKVTVANDGTASVDNIDPNSLTGSAKSAEKVDHKLTVGSKEFDGSANVELTAQDIPIPDSYVEFSDIATGAKTGVVKSSTAANKIAVDASGVMEVNSLDANKINGVVAEAAKVTNKFVIKKYETEDSTHINKKFDGSAQVELTAEDIPVPSDVVRFTDVGTADKTGVVKSSTADNKISINAAGEMEINALTPSKITDAVNDSLKLGGITAQSILVQNAQSENTSKVKAAAAADQLASSFDLSATGDAEGTVAIDGSQDVSLALTLKESLTPAAGTYTKVTVNKKGLVTDATTLAASDIPALTMDKITDAGDLATKDKVAEADFDSALATAFDQLEADSHTHANKQLLDGIDATDVAGWDHASAEIDGKADKATTLAGYNISDAYTKEEVDAKVSAALHYKGTYATFAALQADCAAGTITPIQGDVYNITTAGGTDSKGTAIKAGDNVAFVNKTGEEGAYVYNWDCLGGTTDLSAYATTVWTQGELDKKGSKSTQDQLVLDVAALEQTVGDASAGLVKDVATLQSEMTTAQSDINGLETLVGEHAAGQTPASGLCADVDLLKADDNTAGSVRQLIKASATDLQAAIDAITETTTGTIDTRIAAHNTAADAHATLFAAKQNKVVEKSVTFAVSDFQALSGGVSAYSATKAIAGLDSSKKYRPDITVDGTAASVAAVLSGKFLPFGSVNAGELTVYCNAIPSGAVGLTVSFTEIQD